MASTPKPFNFEAIYEEAEKRLWKHQHSGVRGQLVTASDGLEYWCALVAWEEAQKQ
jgi:hypothetical protein